MKTATAPRRSAAMRVFGLPLLLGTLAAIGLVVALVGDDVWDALSWVLLPTPVAAILWGFARSGPRKSEP